MEKKTSEEIALIEFENVGDEKLFPNHTDKDIWVAGFIAGHELNPWISVKERLPGSDMIVLTFNKASQILPKHFTLGYKWINNGFEITHCMPLPDNPTKG